VFLETQVAVQLSSHIIVMQCNKMKQDKFIICGGLMTMIKSQFRADGFSPSILSLPLPNFSPVILKPE
jgi:hypothetical protein